MCSEAFCCEALWLEALCLKPFALKPFAVKPTDCPRECSFALVSVHEKEQADILAHIPRSDTLP